MAELEIRLSVDPNTGKKNVIISYHSDGDALPMEHEQDHRRIVDQLIDGGALKASELGSIVIERNAEAAASQEPAVQAEAAERQSLEQDQ